MRSRLLTVCAFATMWACGGATFEPGLDGGSEGGAGSSSGGSSGGSSSGSSSGGSSSGSSSGGSSSGSSSGGSSSGGGSGSSSGATGDSGTGPVCPASPPDGGPCSNPGTECEYGTNPNPSCNDVVTCTSTGWSLPTPGPACPPGTCPASYSAVPVGKTCSPAGLDCAYPEGQCNCSVSGPVVGPNPDWQCSMPAEGCAEPRPRIGEACSQPALMCNYGACTGGVALQCVDGSWQRAEVPCPV
jgi:hypothetical protein